MPHPSNDWAAVQFNVALFKGDRLILETTYSEGIGRFPLKYQSAPSFLTKEESDLYYVLQARPSASFKDELRVNKIKSSMAAKIAKYEKAQPDIKNVVYGLLMDAGVIDYSSFEEWADDYGYDVDSRKAESTYQACLKIGLALRSGLGDEGLRQLEEAFQDY